MGRPRKEVSQENIQRFQRELELAGDHTEILLRDKKGRSKSCLLCRIRKQRCDHKLPSCTACLKAAVKCIQPARYTHVTKSDSKADLNTNISAKSDELLSGTPNSDSISTGCSPLEPFPVIKPEKPKKTKVGKPRSNYNNTGNYKEYNALLEKKLRYLENLIDLPKGSSAYNKKLSQYKKICHLLGDIGDLEGTASNTTAKSFMPTPTPHLPNLHLQSNSSPALMHLIQGQDQQKSMASQAHFNQPVLMYSPSMDEPGNLRTVGDIPVLSSDSVDSIDFSKGIFAKYNLNQFLNYDPAFEFDEPLSRLFLDTYFTRLQFKYPLLDEKEIYDFHYYYIHNKIHSFSETEFHFACGRMWLVFSISACLYMTSGKKKGLPPVRYFSTAIRHVTRCGQNLNYIQQVELLTLLVLYVLRTDVDSSVLYDIIKDAMAICKDKLKLNEVHPADPYANKKQKLFWCVYLLERMICISVWKPYTISEAEVNLSLLSEHAFDPSKTGFANNHSNGIFFLNQSLKLRRIESSFVEKLKILPQANNNKDVLRGQLPLVKGFFHDLEIWRASCSRSNFRNYENETLKLYYYRSVRLLIQPYLEHLTPEDRLFRECQAAAGQICQLYKIFHQKTVYGHSTPAVHIVFVAGVTLIYCMWLTRNLDDTRRRKLGDGSKHTRPHVSASLFSTMDDLRACSVCLYAMTERSNFARIYRDTFDQLMNATIGNLIERCGPDSSELIYISSGKNDVVIEEESEQSSKLNSDGTKNDGMPPAVNRIFGKRQSQAYVGFVENSRIAREENKDFKRSKNVLENSSLPKGLSHLLINTETYKSDESTENDSIEKSSSNEDELRSQGTADSDRRVVHEIATSESSDPLKDHYIVKKPNNYKEFDWEPFQQQAYLQQHLAHQNLQAYLSSLNYSTNPPSAHPSTQGTHIAYSHPNSEAPINTSSDVSNAFFDNIINTSPSTSHISPAPNNHTIPIVDSVQTPSEIQHLPMIHPIPTSIENQILLSQSAAQFGNILLSNGAHGMINNISSWTTNSLSSLTDCRLSEHDLFTQANIVAQKDLGIFPVMNENQNTEQSQYNNTYELTGVPSKNATPTIAENDSSLGYPPNGVNRTQLPLVSRNTLNEASAVAPNEECWSANDDYNFLP